MTNYHIVPNKGPAVCHAFFRKCKYGKNGLYSTMKEAEGVYEHVFACTAAKKISKKKSSSLLQDFNQNEILASVNNIVNRDPSITLHSNFGDQDAILLHQIFETASDKLEMTPGIVSPKFVTEHNLMNSISERVQHEFPLAEAECRFSDPKPGTIFRATASTPGGSIYAGILYDPTSDTMAEYFKYSDSYSILLKKSGITKYFGHIDGEKWDNTKLYSSRYIFDKKRDGYGARIHRASSLYLKIEGYGPSGVDQNVQEALEKSFGKEVMQRAVILENQRIHENGQNFINILRGSRYQPLTPIPDFNNYEKPYVFMESTREGVSYSFSLSKNSMDSIPVAEQSTEVRDAKRIWKQKETQIFDLETRVLLAKEFLLSVHSQPVYRSKIILEETPRNEPGNSFTEIAIPNPDVLGDLSWIKNPVKKDPNRS